jgi:TPR repeat protein
LLKLCWLGELEARRSSSLLSWLLLKASVMAFWLGFCFRDGEGCEKDLDKAKENFLLASELGHVSAMIELGNLLDESDPQRWRWWGRAAALGDSSGF